MKKFIMAVFALSVATVIATAGVGIEWGMGYAAYNHTATDLFGSDDALLESSSAIWQLIYTATDTIDPIDLDNVANGYVSGDDVVWGQRDMSVGGGAVVDSVAPGGIASVWSSFLEYSSGDRAYVDLSWNTAGFVYQRIFEGVPAPESWYWESTTLALGLGYDGTPEGSGIQQLDPTGPGSGGIQPNDQLPPAVPEPATMGLLGLGALVMAIRRRRS